MKKCTLLCLLGLALVVTVLLVTSACVPAATPTPKPAATLTPKPAETSTAVPPTPSPVPAVPKRGGILRMGVKGETTGFDLQKIQLTAGKIVNDQLYATLVEYDQDLNVVPHLAESWDISDEGLTYVFHLRPGLKFSNGDDLTSEDVKFTFERMLDPDTGAAWRSYFEVIDTIETPDERTVVFHLKESSGPLLGYFAHQGAGILSKAYIEGGGDINLNPVGAGPFRLKEWIPEYHALLERNPYYYEEGIPYLDGIEFTFSTDENTRSMAIRTGEMDFLQRAPMADFGDVFEKDPNLKIIGGEIGEFRFLDLNNRIAPLNDARVRQAIAWALDRKALLEVSLGGRGVVLDGGNIPPPHWAALEEPYFHQDYEKARELLAEAGYPNGFKLTLMAWGGYDILIRPSEAIASQLAPLGIDITVEVVEQTVFLAKRNEGDFEGYVMGWSGLVDPEQFMAFYETGGPMNYTGFSDPHFDALLEQGRRTMGREERRKIYLEAQKYLCDKSPAIFLFAYRLPDVVRTNVNTDQFHFMYDWSYDTVRYLWFE